VSLNSALIFIQINNDIFKSGILFVFYMNDVYMLKGTHCFVSSPMHHIIIIKIQE